MATWSQAIEHHVTNQSTINIEGNNVMKTSKSLINIMMKLDKIIFDYPIIPNHYLPKREYQLLFDYMLSKKVIRKETYEGFIIYNGKKIFDFNH